MCYLQGSLDPCPCLELPSDVTRVCVVCVCEPDRGGKTRVMIGLFRTSVFVHERWGEEGVTGRFRWFRVQT